MVPLGWTGVVLGALATGAAIAGILVLPRKQEPLAAVIALACTAVTLGSIGVLTSHSSSSALTVFSGLIAVATSGGGYALVAALMPTIGRARPGTVDLPEATDGTSLLLLLVETEPAAYTPAEVTRQLDEFADAGLPEPSIAVLPFLYASHKARYRAVGGSSPERDQANALAEAIGSRLDPSRIAGPVVVSCEDDTLLAETIAAAAGLGFDRVITVSPYVHEPLSIDRAKRAVDAARIDPERIGVAHATSPLETDRIVSRVAERIGELADAPARTGVALVVHAQPGRRGQDYSEFESAENAFANRVRMMVAESGIAEERIRVCWDGWKEPDITETVRHLAVLGADRVLVVPATYPFENLDTLLEVPVAIKQARTAEGVHVVQLPAWRDDPIVAGEIVRAVESVASPS